MPLVALATAWSAAARAAASFTAALDREAVAPGEPFIYQITLQTSGDDAADFRPPDFHGSQVQEARGPSKSTSIQMVFGSNQRDPVELHLDLPAGAGRRRQGAAQHRGRAREGRRAGPGDQRRRGARRCRRRGAGARVRAARPEWIQTRCSGGCFRAAGPVRRRAPEPDVLGATPAFIRVVADKTRAFVGEQVTVAWYLYVVDVPSRFGQVSEPHTDGFWSEDIPSTTPPGRLAFGEQQTIAGRAYNVALLFKKALFPLAPGKLTITPMEAELTQQADFFAPAEVRRLKTDPLVIEAEPLPARGAPPHFDAANVGRYEISAAVDRAAVSVGDAVTLKVAVKGTGNVRNVRPPALPPLPGWKSYEPKTDVAVDGAATITGTKTVEWLMRPERPGKTTVPALVLETFDPAARRYETVRSQPIEIAVSGEAGSNAVPSAGTPSGPAGLENVVAGNIRPIHARGGLSGESGAAFLHSAGFTATVVTPPLALAALALFGRHARAAGRATRGGTGRGACGRWPAGGCGPPRRTARRGGRATSTWRSIACCARRCPSGSRPSSVACGSTSWGRSCARAVSRTARPPAVLGALEACDEARFAPGGAAADPAALSAMLARAGELIDAIERAPLGEGARA